MLLFPTPPSLSSLLVSSGVSREGGGDERSGLLSLTEPDEGVEAVPLLACSIKKHNNDRIRWLNQVQ